MQKHFKILFVSLLCAASVTAPAFAHAESSTDSTQNKTQKPTPTKTEQEIQAEKQKLKERMEKQKTDLKIKLDAAQEARIKARCKTSQGIIKTIEVRAQTNAPKREQAYQQLKDHVTKLVEKLKSKGVNTSELEKQLVVLNGKIDTFKSNKTAYIQAVSDAQNVDCAADPAGFKAALETARSKRDTLIKSANEIKDYVKTSIKPTLSTIRGELESNKTSNQN